MANDRKWHIVGGWGNPSKWLLRNEVRIFEVRRHWIVMAMAGLEMFGYWAIAVMLVFLFEGVDFIESIAALIFLGSLVRIVFVTLEWLLERLVLTDRRMVLVSGVLNRKSGNVPLPKITDMTFEKPLVGRLLGYGSFVVESAGQDQALSRVDYLPKGDVLYEQVATLLYGRRDEREAMIAAARDNQLSRAGEGARTPVAVGVAPGAPDDGASASAQPYRPYTGLDLPSPAAVDQAGGAKPGGGAPDVDAASDAETTSPIPVYRDRHRPDRLSDDGTGSSDPEMDASGIENPVRHRDSPRLFRPR